MVAATVRILAGCVLAGCVLAGCAQRVPTVGPTPSAAPTPTYAPTPNPTPFTGELTDLLVPRPEGARAAKLNGVVDGPVDLAQVAGLMTLYTNDQQELLRELGFERGAFRGWLGGEVHDEALIVLLQFTADQGAASWVVAAQRALGNAPETRTGRYDDKRLGTWFAVDGGSDLTFLYGVFATGSFGVLVRTAGPGGPPLETHTAICAAQLELLD